MTDSVGTILTSSFSSFKTKLQPLLIGAALLGVLTYGLQMATQQKMNDMMGGNPSMNMEQLEDMAKRAEGGDVEAMKEMMEEAGMMDDGDMPEREAMEAMGKAMFTQALPGLFWLTIINLAISLVASAYYLLLAIDAKATFQSALSGTPKLFLPLLGVWIWSFLRSFAWIPVIGIVFAIVLGPRFILSSVILVKEKKGVMDCVKLSYERSRGYWGKIVGNCIVAGICMWVVMLVWGIIAAMLPLGSLTIALSLVVGYALMGYATIFVVKLAETIMANQLKLGKK